MLIQRILRSLSRNKTHCNINSLTFNKYMSIANYSTGNEELSEELQSKQGGFAKAFKKHEEDLYKQPEKKSSRFTTLLRKSKFVDLGDPDGKIVAGTIFHVVEDDLYIDFGWKFHCVCTRPVKNSSDYVRGARVRLLVKDLELSTRFLGSEKDLTILEADCLLLGLLSSPVKTATSKPSNQQQAVSVE